MRFVSKKYVLFIPIVFCCLFSCKKDADEDAPKIEMSFPLENQSFSVNQYVYVAAKVSDNVELTSVSITLLDINKVPIHTTVPMTIPGREMNINYQYILDNIHLLSGYYYMMIFASDGEHDTYAYRKIYISAVPKVLKQVYLFSNTGSATTNLSIIDSAFTSIIPYHSYAGDYLGSGVTSYYQQMNVCGNYDGDLEGTNLQYNIAEYNYPATGTTFPFYTGFYSDEQREYVARYDEQIIGYNHAGTGIYSGTAISGFYGQHICFNADRMIVEQKDKITGGKKLVTYFNTGSQEQNCNLYQDVVQFCEKDGSNVFVFGNSAGQGIIQLYDRAANNLWSPYPFPLATGTILSVLQLDADNYLIAHSNGTIYLYKYSVNSVTTFLAGYTAVKLKYDDVSDILYVVEANQITKLTYPALAPAGTLSSPENILDLHLLYNR